MVISDDTHAASSKAVTMVSKAEELRELPLPSWWYLDIQAEGGYRRFSWDTQAERDDFYTKLINAMT